MSKMHNFLIQIDAIFNDKSPESRQEKIDQLKQDAPALESIFDKETQSSEKIKM